MITCTTTGSTLTKDQEKILGPRTDSKLVRDYGHGARLTAKVSYDDECNNGHNTFSITGEVITTASARRRDTEAAGQLHGDIARLFPELAPLIKWHLSSSDEPLHYVANTLYWLGYSGYCDGKTSSPPNFAYARKTAVWLDMPEDLLAASQRYDKNQVEVLLRERLSALQAEFRSAVEAFGFTF